MTQNAECAPWWSLSNTPVSCLMAVASWSRGRPTSGGLNYFGQPNHVREPICIHSTSQQPQPMSACRICKDDARLRAWREWWDRYYLTVNDSSGADS